jgi:dipeptidyl-peptidase-4
VQQHVYRVPLDGKPAVKLDDVDGVASAWSKHDITVITTDAHAGGIHTVAVSPTARHELPSVAETPSLVPTTTIETVQVGGRTQYIAVTRPRAFDPHKKYPVIVKVYGGPHAVTVMDARDNYTSDQLYADAGFIVFRTDGRGTPNRGRAWERSTLKDLIHAPMDDQVDGLRAAAANHPEMDMTRVGITGWSFGGYFTLMALLLRPDVYVAGVAGAPVTDWSLYDTAYTERYMKTPQQNPDGYKATSANEIAGKLTRPLLLIHGITDDNVHFANSLSFIEAMYLAGKHAEVITLSSTHMVPDPKLLLAREKVQIDFFRTHLGPPH